MTALRLPLPDLREAARELVALLAVHRSRIRRESRPRVYVYLSYSGVEMIQWGMPGEVRFYG
jgi:hypothetical protein